jgi:probable F420-dependent oxidoreductase
VKFGVALPNCTEGLCYPVPFTSPELVGSLARRAEHLGFDSVWCNDHLTTQRYVRGSWSQPPSYYDPFVSLSFVAAATQRIRLGTSIVVLPMREPVATAKASTTLDAFSGGRLILGVGVGAYREEFEAVQPRVANANRSEMMDEGLEALNLLLTERSASFAGAHYEFHDVEMYPKPVQQPLPVWVAGNTSAAAERAGRWGHGWLPAALPREHIQRHLAALYRAAESTGRDPSSIEVAPQWILSLAGTHQAAVERFKRSFIYEHLLSLKGSTLKDQDLSTLEDYNLVGTPAEVIDKIEQFSMVGVTYCASLAVSGNTGDDVADQIQLFAEDVMPHFSPTSAPLATA